MASRARLESDRRLRQWCAPLTGRVLSLGSGTDRDGTGVRYRDYFKSATSYTTSEWPGSSHTCDLTLDVRSMPEVADGAYDVLLCSGVLEHVDDLWAALREMWRVLAPGGVLLVGVPFRQGLHHLPRDFWRFTENGIRYLLRDYAIDSVVAIDTQGNPGFPAAYWVKAQKPAVVKRSRVKQTAAPSERTDTDYTPPLSVICWKWRGNGAAHLSYGPQAVNTLRWMVERCYPHPHRFICVTDDARGIDSRVEIVPLWNDHADVPSPHGRMYPSCYRRLRMFASDIESVFGPRFVSLDLDCVLTGDMTQVWGRQEDFVIWKDTHKNARYNASMVLLRAGARRDVWEAFDPKISPAQTLASGICNGSDQGWISYRLGTGEATWTAAHGVYSFKNQVRHRSLPPAARIVFFHGHVKPWSSEAQRLPWVRAYYQVSP